MDLLDRFLRVFGTTRVRLRWRLQALREKTRRKAAWAENRSRAVRYEHQTCPSCGLPASRDERTCAKCGARLEGVTLHRMSRLVGWLIPEGWPAATIALVALNVVAFLFTLEASADLAGGGMPDGVAPTQAILVRWGALLGPGLEHGQWWRVLTAVFLHAGPMHLAMNGIGLWVAGQSVEDRFGGARALVVFVLAGVGGSLASYLVRGGAVFTVGASGAVFGLMGCIVGSALRHRGRAERELRARFIPWVIYGLVIGFAVPGVDNLAHIGGLVTGGVMGALMGERTAARRAPAWLWQGLAVLGLLAVAGCFWLAARVPLSLYGL